MRRAVLSLALAAASATPSFARAAPEPVPDERLVDQDGREVGLVTDVMGDRVVAVNFVRTTCATVCAPMTAVLSRVQDRLGARVGKEVALVSIALDPARDTPERLAAFGARFGRRSGWTFLSGDVHRLRRVLKGLGGWDSERSVHGPFLLVGDARTGRFRRVDGFAPPARIVEEIERAVAAGKAGAALPAGARPPITSR